MAEVNVMINGRKYRMACEEGQEAHLTRLAERFDGLVESFKSDFGEIGDTRLTVMAGIAVLDELVETERRLAQAQSELEEVSAAGRELAEESEDLERRFGKKIEEVARRLEIAASAIDGAGSGESQPS